MATVAELSGPYANFMLNPRPLGTPGMCSVCPTFTDGPRARWLATRAISWPERARNHRKLRKRRAAVRRRGREMSRLPPYLV